MIDQVLGSVLVGAYVVLAVLAVAALLRSGGLRSEAVGNGRSPHARDQGATASCPRGAQRGV